MLERLIPGLIAVVIVVQHAERVSRRRLQRTEKKAPERGEREPNLLTLVR